MKKRLVAFIMGILCVGVMLNFPYAETTSAEEVYIDETEKEIAEEEETKLEVGDTCSIGKFQYEILSETEVSFVGIINPPSCVVVPQNVVIEGSTFTVTEVGDAYFMGMTEVEEIQLPSTITVIQENAFCNLKSLKKITINGKAQLKTIKDRAFSNCVSLESVDLSSVSTIGDEVFESCEKLQKITFSNKLTTIGKRAFSNCSSLEELKLPNSVTSIGELAFAWSGLKEVQIPKKVTKISKQMYYGCESLVRVEIPKHIKTIGDYAFGSCVNVEEFVLNEGLTTIGKRAFSNCERILRMEIPESLTSIGEGAFSQCRRLRWINIPSKVKTIKKESFSGCINLTTIGIHDKLKKVHSKAFSYGIQPGGSIRYIVTIYTSKNSYFYKHQKKWPKDTGVTFKFETGEMPKLYFETWDTNGGEFVAGIYGNPYIGKSHHRCLKKDKWHKTIAYIPEVTREGYTFKGWYTKKTGGKNIIKNKVTMAKDATYYAHWEKAKTYTVGKYKYQITKDKEVAFVGVKSKKTTKVSIPTTVKIKGKKYKVTSIASKALKGNKKIKSIVITQNIRVIGDEAFRGCSKLAKITFDVGPDRSGPNGVISGTLMLDKVGDNIFKGIKSNAVIYIPKDDYDFKFGDVRMLQNKGQGKKVKFKKY